MWDSERSSGGAEQQSKRWVEGWDRAIGGNRTTSKREVESYGEAGQQAKRSDGGSYRRTAVSYWHRPTSAV